MIVIKTIKEENVNVVIFTSGMSQRCNVMFNTQVAVFYRDLKPRRVVPKKHVLRVF